MELLTPTLVLTKKVVEISKLNSFRQYVFVPFLNCLHELLVLYNRSIGMRCFSVQNKFLGKEVLFL